MRSPPPSKEASDYARTSWRASTGSCSLGTTSATASWQTRWAWGKRFNRSPSSITFGPENSFLSLAWSSPLCQRCSTGGEKSKIGQSSTPSCTTLREERVREGSFARGSSTITTLASKRGGLCFTDLHFISFLISHFSFSFSSSISSSISFISHSPLPCIQLPSSQVAERTARGWR